VTGSIAAVKAPDLVHRLKKEGARVSCVMTPAGTQFVTPLALATLSGEPAYCEMFEVESYKMPHLSLAEGCDVFLIAPASVNVLGRLAAGLTEDLVTLCALTTKAPIILAPAMHPTLWKHPATSANVERLRSFGYHIAGPQTGVLADGTIGEGRMLEPADLVDFLKKILSHK